MTPGGGFTLLDAIFNTHQACWAAHDASQIMEGTSSKLTAR
jgi:hypothetical protein